ncbi:hypothetical protein HPB49_008403 [Dermacentor silvarum]|uniref:Uncharacterized protein n=1 Tax=Dermacentor silvarum TaxID=543639 RepID=A0ACB8DNH3_DERSI|nr:hypothetical protein HPB49_008403 [Dermacentor silvarum]
MHTRKGGLRGVVWADCVQGIVLFAAPFVIIAKTVYDSAHVDVPLRPLSDFNSREHLLSKSHLITAARTLTAAGCRRRPRQIREPLPATADGDQRSGNADGWDAGILN